jgi:hypothetical protein
VTIGSAQSGKVVSVAADRFVIEMHAGTDSFTVVGFDDVRASPGSDRS